MTRRLCTMLLGPLLLLSACSPIALSQEWELDRLRLLAIRAEPAEPRPGDTVTFTSLAHIPVEASGETPWTSVWIACLLGSGDGCTLDPALLERLEGADTLSPEEQAMLFAALQAAGFIGFEPVLSPAWPVPADALEGLTEAETLEGLSATVQVTLATEGDTELVLRAIPVSLAATPNTNPDVAALTLDDAPVVDPVTVDDDTDVTLVANVAALEEYTYVTTEGVTETRTEELEWRWYTDGGTLASEDGELIPEAEDTLESTVTWHTPDAPGDYRVHAVVLDARGGMGWWSQTLSVE